jgi:uncharacterized protein (TIGR02231 family)
MKKILLYMLVFSIGWVVPGYASQLLSSNITDVTLFSNQALISRTCYASVQPGLNELLVEIKAFAVDKDSVSARVFGHGEIVSVQVRDIHLTEFPQDHVRTLEEKLRLLKRLRMSLNDKKAVLAKKEAFLDSLIDFSKIQMPKDIQTHFPDVENLKETIDYLGFASETINQEKQKLNHAIDEKNREIEKLSKELADIRGGRQKAKRAVEVLFKADQTEKIRIEVQYLVKNASWKPFYKVSVPLDLSDIDLTMFSRIFQKSGEDWKKVNLSISNVIPLKGVRLPKLSSWFLDIPRLPKPIALGKSRAMKSELGAALEMEEGADYSMQQPKIAAETMQAAQKELPLSFEYQIPYPVDIESRSASSLLPILTKKITGNFFHYAIPKRTPLTFLVSETTADRELLSGQLNVYFGGRYIGETYLAEKKAGAPFYLNLGADRAVKVKREKLKDKIKETYFGTIQRDTVVREFEYKITAENMKKQVVRLKIEDSVPVSKTDKIQVKDVKMIPDPDARNYKDKEGVMLWEFKMDPGEKKEIQINYIVTYPTKSPPFGL